MKQRSLLVLLVVLGGGTIVLALLLSWTRDVTYQGKALSLWLTELDDSSPAVAKRAREAIQDIGSRATPFLLQEILAKNSGTKRKLMRLAQEHSGVELPFQVAEFRRYRAVRGFEVLGPKAQPAIPALTKALASASVGHDAAHALAGIGAAAVPALVSRLYDKNETARLNAVIGLGRFRAVPELAVPALLKASTDENLYVRCLAIVALRRSGQESLPLLSRFTQCLSDTNSAVRRLTATTLGQWGPRATSAVPALVKGLQDPHAGVRRDVTNALLKISPALAAKAGVK